MKKAVRKSISLLLTLCMVATMLVPMAAMAENADNLAGEVPGISDTLPMVDVIAPKVDAPVPEGDDIPSDTEVVNTLELDAPTVPEGPCTVQSGNEAVTYIHSDGTTVTPVETTNKDVDGTWYGYQNLRYVLIKHTAPIPEVYPAATLTFQGTGITVYGQGAANGPLMSVTIDDKPEGNADFNGSGSVIKVYEKLGLVDGQHTIKLTFTRETNSTTASTKTGLQAAIDRFEIAGAAAPLAVTVVSGATDKATALPGDTVTITAAAPDEGMAFRSWASSDGVVFADPNASSTTFTMPAKPVTVTAGYKLSGSEKISPEGMTATSPSEEPSNPSTEGPASLVLDGDPSTFWCTHWTEHPTAENRYIMLDLGGPYNLDGITYVERPGSNGRITDYDVLVSTDGETFTSVATGKWVPGNKSEQRVDFAPALATHIKLLAVHTEGNPADAFATAAELRATGVAIAPITQTKGAEGKVKLNFDATKFPDENYKYYYSNVTTSAGAPALGEARDTAVYTTELTDGIELVRAKRQFVNVVLVDGNDKVATFRSIEVTHGEPQEYLVTVVGGGTVTGGGQDAAWLPAGDTATITTPENGEATMTFHHWSGEDGVVFANSTSATTTFPMLAKAVTVTANYVYPAGTTFYLDAEDGDDTNTGLAVDQPWKTLGKMDNVLLQPGDKVLLKAGSVFERQSLSLRGSGSEEAPIIVDMYDGAIIGAEAGAKPHVKANGVAKADFSVGKEGDTGITSRPNVAYGVHIKNVSYIQVNNLEITNNSGTRQMAVGVVVEAASGNGLTSGIHLDGLYVHDVYGTLLEKTAPNGGIFMITTPGSVGTAHETRYDDISVQNCSVVDVSRTGISVGSSHSAYYWEGHTGGIIPDDVKNKYGHTKVVISNNYVEEAGGDAIVPQFCIEPLVEYNISNAASLNTKGNWGAMYNAAIWPWRCEDAIFQFNEAYDTFNNGDGQAYDCDSSRGTTYQYNYSHDNEGGFMLICAEESVESVIRYNISQNDLDSLFLVSNNHSAEIYNNTFYIGDGMSKIVDVARGGVGSVKNNIFYNASGKPGMAGWGNFTYENNLFYGFDTMPNDAKKITVDPLFADPGSGKDGVEGNSAIDTLTGYELMAGSPAIDAGLVIAENGGRDYAGNSVSATEKPNIGALEGASTQIPVTKVELDQESLALVSNGSPDTATLVATVTPETATNTAVVWSSSDEAIATVDASGVVTAKAGGTAIITVTTENRKLTDACTVTVTTINTGSSTPAPKPEPPKTDAETGNTVVEIPVKPTVSGDKATANVSAKTVTAAVDAAVKAAEQGGTNANVEITVSAPKDAKTVELSIPKEAVNAVATGKTECLIISSPVAEISLDSKALSAIAEAAGGTVKIAVSKMETKSIDATEQGKIGAAPVFDLTITSGTTAISDFKGGAAAITVPHTLAEGQDGKFVAVWYLADGKLSHVEGAYAEGMTTFTVGHFSRYAIGYLPFTDVAPGWYYESVVYAYNHEIFGGVGANTFAPQDSMTRAMLVTVLARLDGQDTTTGESWDTVGMAWAKENDISDGSGLEQAISREQLAVMLYRYAKAEKTEADLKDFSDTGSVSAWAAEAMSWAVKSGIITGKSGALDPQGNATRAEVATMLTRFAEQLAK